ncbi:MAG TPA: EAL domain-containing protein [Actinomycetota bacterium]|nr:EAL domain-containing protein [Actinomycetota bacterium]
MNTTPATESPGRGPGAPGARFTGAQRVWILTGIIAVISLAMYVGLVLGHEPIKPSYEIPWWVLAAGFFAAEIFVVHIQLRRDDYSFSLSEIPLVLGLFFASAEAVIFAHVVGAGAALIVHRRQSLLKLAFNVSHFLLEVSLAVAAFRLFAGVQVTVGVMDSIAAMLVTLIATWAALFMIFTAVAMSQGSRNLTGLSRALVLGSVTTLTNSSIGLVGVTILGSSPASIWLLAVPSITLFIAYRAYTSEQTKHESIEFLYQSTSILHKAQEMESAMLSLLEQTRQMFRAEIAQIVLLSSDGQKPLRTTLGPGETAEIMRPDGQPAGVFRMVVDERRGVRLSRPIRSDDFRARFAPTQVKDAMIAPLRGETHVLGQLIVVNRLGDVTSFDDEDLKLFETLANHASIALENGRLEKSLAEVTRLKEELRHQAYHDPLTSLANRSLFLDRLRHALARRRTAHREVAVIFVDLDDFKTVNDSLGHAAGDQLLCGVADRLRGICRPADTVARLGGDEFAILLEESTPVETIAVAERLIDELETPFELAHKEIYVRASVGIASHGHAGDAESLMRNADAAMYQAKSHGKGRFELYDPSMQKAALNRLEMKGRLQRAVERDEIEIFYQPTIALATGNIHGAEALVRWRQPGSRRLTPVEFIPLAEETGLINVVGRHVLEQACLRMREWTERYPVLGPLKIAVNISARQLQQPDLVEIVGEAVSAAGLSPSQLVLEITESVLLQDTDATIRLLQELKALNVQLAIDDFGTGYSSLSYLQRLPMDIIKIDKSFVHGVGGSAEDEALTRAIVKLAQTFRLKVVAEGIERQEQMDRLRQMRCHLGQGYLFSPPVPAQRFEELLGAAVGGADAELIDFATAVKSLPGRAPATSAARSDAMAKDALPYDATR